MVNIEQVTQTAMELLMSYGPKVLLAVLTLIVGFWVIKRMLGALELSLERSKIEVTLRRFLVNVSGVVFKAVIIISVAAMVGIETTSFIAMLGARQGWRWG